MEYGWSIGGVWVELEWTPQVGKLMERIVMEEMIEFLVRNKLLSDNQHGFKKHRSCLSELLSHHSRILEALLNGDNYDTLYLDYQKAFDRCDQGVAAFAIRKFGFQGDLGAWLYDFMRDRVQWVVANNAISSPSSVKSGVPQGSVLTFNLPSDDRKHKLSGIGWRSGPLRG